MAPTDRRTRPLTGARSARGAPSGDKAAGAAGAAGTAGAARAAGGASAPSAAPAAGPEPLDPAALRSWLSVVRAYHLCEALMSRRLAALGVRLAEHEVLANLQREPGLSQQALAARCFTAKSHVSALLTDLESRGLVRREPDPADARAKRLTLSAAGARLANRTVQAQAEVVALMAAAVTPQAMVQVQAAMQALSERLEDELARGR
jgi:DNA-binding MarR family transcriptional regulator